MTVAVPYLTRDGVGASVTSDRVGLVEYPAEIGSDDEVLEAAIEAGAADVVSSVSSTPYFASIQVWTVAISVASMLSNNTVWESTCFM